MTTRGIMDVYLRTGCIGEPGRVVGDRNIYRPSAKAPRNALHVVDCSMSHGLLQQHVYIQN